MKFEIELEHWQNNVTCAPIGTGISNLAGAFVIGMKQ